MKIRAIPPIVALMISIASGRGQVASRAQGSPHFVWNERAAHKLNPRQTLANARGLTPDDRKALEVAVASQLNRHREPGGLLDVSDDAAQQLAANTRIEFVDLNHDGRAEVIAQALGPCGATGNCTGWIFQLAFHRVKVLLDSTDSVGGFDVVTVRPSSTGGFRDIVLGTHPSAGERDLYLYQYLAGNYRLSACYAKTSPRGPGFPNNVVITPIRCPQPEPLVKPAEASRIPQPN